MAGEIILIQYYRTNEMSYYQETIGQTSVFGRYVFRNPSQ